MDNKIESLVEDIILHRLGNRFSFFALVKEFISEVDKKDLVKNGSEIALPCNIKLSEMYLNAIQSAVWKMIWNQQLMVALYRNPYRSLHAEDFEIIKVKQNEQS